MKSNASPKPSKSPQADKKAPSFFNSKEKETEPFFKASSIQPKLEIGDQDDPQEKQADEVADEVIQPQPQITPPVIQPKEEEKRGKQAEPVIQPSRSTSEQDIIQPKLGPAPVVQPGNGAGKNLSQQLQDSKTSGQGLDDSIRMDMSRKIGADFSKVKIHTGSNAAEMNQSLNARAFTHGNNIYFNSGEYDPSSTRGKHLLAHELTHVVQQSSSPGNIKIQRAGGGEKEQTETPAPRNLQVPWQGSYTESMFRYFEPFSKVSHKELISVIETISRKKYFFFTDKNDKTGETVDYNKISRLRFEQLMRKHSRNSFQVEASVADYILKKSGGSWKIYDLITENPEVLKTLSKYSIDGFGIAAEKEFPDKQAEKPAVEYPTSASKDDIALLKRFIDQLYEGSPPAPPDTGENLLISTDDIAAVHDFYNSPEKEQKAVLELLRNSGNNDKKTGSARSLNQIITNARSYNRVQNTADLMNEKLDHAEHDDQKPIVERPVDGEILSYDSKSSITTGMETRFFFKTDDQVDAFRVPHVLIRWQALRRTEGKDGAERIASDTTNYIEIDEHSLLNEKIFEVTFEKAGVYEIHAIVDHNFYLPDAFHERVTVIPPQEVLDALRKENDPSFGDSGARPHKPNFDFEALSDLGSFDEGYRYYGELSDEYLNTEAGSFRDSYSEMKGDISKLQDLIKHYREDQKENGNDNKDLISWAKQRIKRLQNTLYQLKSYDEGEGSLPISTSGYFASQTSGVPHHKLNLVVWFSYTKEDGDSGWYSGHLFDHTGIATNENLHFTAKDESFEGMAESLFLKLSKDYPDGQMSISFQLYKQQNASGNLVTFERTTETVSGEIAEVLFSAPASIAVNATAAVLTVFPPTTGLGIALGISYNSLATAYSIKEAYESDTLRMSHAVDAGLVFLDILPVIGKGVRGFITAGRVVRTVKSGSRTLKALQVGARAGEIAGEVYLFTDEAVNQINNIHDKQIVKLADVINRIQTLQAHGAPPHLVKIEQKRAEHLQNQLKLTIPNTLAELAANQFLSITTPAAARRMAKAHTSDKTSKSDRSSPESITDQHSESPLRDKANTPEGKASDQSESTTENRQHLDMNTVAGKPDPTILPAYIVVDKRPLHLKQHEGWDNHEVRINYENDHNGMITRVWIEAGKNATRKHIQQHADTIRLMQRYQGISGALRIFLTRMNNIIARYSDITGHVPEPGSRAFEAEAEIKKLPPIIQQRAEQLSGKDLKPLERANIMAEIDQLEADLQKHIDTFERLDLETGAGFVAARDKPKSNQAALDADYPKLDEAPGHYYVHSPTGGFYLRRFAGSDDPPKQIQWEDGDPVIRDRTGNSVVYDPPETLRPGETRNYTGPKGTEATATRRKRDSAVVIQSEVGPGRGRLGYEKAMFSGVDVGLKGWHRAHSQGQGTGHESSFGILYAPSDVNLKYQNSGIEQHIRDLFKQIDPDVTLLLTTETIAHSGTRRLESITYKIEAKQNGKRTRLYEVEINVEDARTNPKVKINASQYADIETFLKGSVGRPAGTDPAKSKAETVKPVPEKELPPQAAETISDLDIMIREIQKQNNQSHEVDLLESARQKLRENPTDANISNAREALHSAKESQKLLDSAKQN